MPMTCYLAIVESEYECEGGCAGPVGPGLIGMTDQLRGSSRELAPICGICLSSLDPRLAGVRESALPIETIEVAGKCPEDDRP